MEPVGGRYKGVYKNTLKSGDTAYYIAYRDENGKSVKKKVGVNTRQNRFTSKDAYDELIRVKHELSTGQELTLQNRRKKSATLDECFEFFVKQKTADGKKSLNTDVERYNEHIRKTLGSKEVSKIKSKEIDDFKLLKLTEKQERIKKPLAPQTVTHLLTLISNIINFAIKKEHIPLIANPVAKVDKPKADNQKAVFFSYQEAGELLGHLKYHPNPNLYQLVTLLLFTGARFSEIASMRWHQVNVQTNLIYFPRCKDGNPRHIAMTKMLRDVIMQLQKNKKGEGGLVIPNTLGEIYSEPPDAIQKAIDYVVPGNKEAASIHRLTVHTLRHTHASWLAIEGLDILQIKEQLGHRQITTTMRYAHLIPSKRHEFTKKMDEIAFGGSEE